MPDPDWLVWAREIGALAQTGLAFSKDPYDLERYASLRRLTARIMSEHTGACLERIEGLFDSETGYATPKVGVRGAVFDAAGRVLMVREVADGNRWTLPGGWADVNQTPGQSVVREVFEESGYQGPGGQAGCGVGPRATRAATDGVLGDTDVFCLRLGRRRRSDEFGNERGRVVRRERHTRRLVVAPDAAGSHQPDVCALAGSGVGD